jgi:hypothetical protein
MSVKAQVAIAFSSVFPNLGEARPEFLKNFAKVFKFVRAYAKNKLKEELTDIDVFEFVDELENVNSDLLQYAREFYRNELTRSSQVSVIKNLALAELEAIRRRENLRPEAALDYLVTVDKLEPHMKDLWLLMPRRARGMNAVDAKKRQLFPLTKIGKYIFKALLAVDARYEVTDAREVFDKYYFDLKREINLGVPHRYRTTAFARIYEVARKLGIASVRTEIPALEIEDLPPKLREQVKKFEERAPLGIGAFPSLKRLAIKNGFKQLKRWKVTSVYNYIAAFLVGAAHMELDDDVGIEDLLRLETRDDDPDDKINRYVERYRTVELAIERLGFKQANFDSAMFSRNVSAICAIGRFNGIFDLQEKFREHYKLSLDLDSKALRKSLKKKRMSRKWIDDWIRETKPKFDNIISKKSFLTSTRDRRLCLFFVQLVVLRFQGFRQQCLRKCVIGKNLIIGKNSIIFHYEPGEIKNEVLIHTTLSKEIHGGIEEIVLLIDVLRKYKYGLLDVIRSLYPSLYEKNMGGAFFAMSSPEEGGLVKKYEAADETDSNRVQYEREARGKTTVYHTFTESAYDFMSSDHLADFPYHFHPHFLRGVCCDWLVKDLKMTWEEVAKCMGDREQTLKRDYYEEGDRVQDATDPLARVSRERKADGESKEGGDAASLATMKMVQQSLDVMGRQLKKMEERAERAEKEAAVAKSQVEFLLRQHNLNPADLISLTSAMAVSI